MQIGCEISERCETSGRVCGRVLVLILFRSRNKDVCDRVFPTLMSLCPLLMRQSVVASVNYVWNGRSDVAFASGSVADRGVFPRRGVQNRSGAMLRR